MSELSDLLLDMLSAPRMLVSIALGIAGAILLASQIDWFSGGMGVVLVLLSFGAGLAWEGQAAQAAEKRTAEQGHRVFKVFLALVLCAVGLVWMFTAGPWVSSIEGRLAVLGGTPMAVGGLYALVFWRPVPVRPMLFAACSLLSGPATLTGLLVAQGFL
jgi:hypothetical protein